MKYLALPSLVLLLTVSAFASDEEMEKRFSKVLQSGWGGFGGGYTYRPAGIVAVQPVASYVNPTVSVTEVKPAATTFSPSIGVPKVLKREAQDEENKIEKRWQQKILGVEPLQLQQTVAVAQPSIAVTPAVQVVQPSIAVQPAVQVVQPSIAVQPAIQTVQTGISSPGVSVVQSSIKKRQEPEHETEKRYVKTVSGGYSAGGFSTLGGVSILGGGLSTLGRYSYQPTLTVAQPTYTVSQPTITVAKPTVSTAKILKRRSEPEHETEKRFVKTLSGGYPAGGLTVLGGGSTILGGGLSTVGGYSYQPTVTVAQPTYRVSQPAITVAEPTVSTTKILKRSEQEVDSSLEKRLAQAIQSGPLIRSQAIQATPLIQSQVVAATPLIQQGYAPAAIPAYQTIGVAAYPPVQTFKQF